VKKRLHITPWLAITDGSTWGLYYMRKVKGRLAPEVRIAEEPVEEVVRKLFSLSRRLVASGGIREVGALEPGRAREGSKEQAVEHGPKSVKCPYCGYEADASIFKLLRSPWRYGFYEVRMLECLECHGIFNHYHGVGPRGRVSEYVIRVKPGVKGVTAVGIAPGTKLHEVLENSISGTFTATAIKATTTTAAPTSRSISAQPTVRAR